MDEAVLEALLKEKSETIRPTSELLWEGFRQSVYTEGKGFRHPKLGMIGGPADQEVKTVINEFSDKLAAAFKKFCLTLTPLERNSLQELLLTGGGNFIPSIREAFQKAAQELGLEFIKIHAPNAGRSAPNKLFHRLDAASTRGGSALGGSSIYFESEFA